MTEDIKLHGRVRILDIAEEPDLPPAMYRREGILYRPLLNGGRTVDRFHQPVVPSAIHARVAMDQHNHITTIGRVRAAELIGGLSAGFVDRIAVGDGGLFDGTSTPKPPRNDQESLHHEIARLERKTVVVDVDTPSVTFVGIFKNVGSYQFLVPGVARISEVGLYTPDNMLCAVYNFAPLPVDVHRLGFMIEWQWSLR